MADCSTSIIVLVGGDKHAFHPDEQQLCACLPVFLSMLRSGFREAEERVVLLPEVDAESFQVFERWLSNCGESVFEDLDLALLCKVFYLMDYLQVSSVQQLSISHILLAMTDYLPFGEPSQRTISCLVWRKESRILRRRI